MQFHNKRAISISFNWINSFFILHYFFILFSGTLWPQSIFPFHTNCIMFLAEITILQFQPIGSWIDAICEYNWRLVFGQVLLSVVKLNVNSFWLGDQITPKALTKPVCKCISRYPVGIFSNNSGLLLGHLPQIKFSRCQQPLQLLI